MAESEDISELESLMNEFLNERETLGSIQYDTTGFALKVCDLAMSLKMIRSMTMDYESDLWATCELPILLGENLEEDELDEEDTM